MEKEEEEQMKGLHGAPRKAEAAAAVAVGGGNTHEVPRSTLPSSHSGASTNGTGADTSGRAPGIPAWGWGCVGERKVEISSRA